jgi:hypothetical protein
MPVTVSPVWDDAARVRSQFLDQGFLVGTPGFSLKPSRGRESGS